MILVYLEDERTAELFAILEDDNTYMMLLPVIEKVAEQRNMIVTEAETESSIGVNFIGSLSS